MTDTPEADAAIPTPSKPQWWPLRSLAWVVPLAAGAAFYLATDPRISTPGLQFVFVAVFFGAGTGIYGLVLGLAPDDGPRSARRVLAALTTAVTFVAGTGASAWIVVPVFGKETLALAYLVPLGWGVILLVAVGIAHARAANRRRRSGEA